ncbi:glycogen debranching protein GlgX [Methylovorus glucosotrophus]|uniref:Glycogen debranching enzyme GlgX n=1 Tax=Methylovorus glucosotrophus (strain SIP3-4) TaxID=582744 RepID=C6X9S1_METGS|nr:glycogen debranching protein GlgX [Methylovorus glucosotrophus]ACT49891.1 glycogen debranching enzyme GlgX [Methylovorus glucosotrophus SIP3-4]
MRTIKEGSPFPRGATYDGKGTNFALFSDNATGVTLCLFSADGKEVERIDLTECTNGVWYVYIPDIQPGQLYGYRVHGPWDPVQGQRFNSNKLLLDPYARKLSGDIQWDDALYGYQLSPSKDADLRMDDRDSAAFMPKAIVVDPAPLTKSNKPQVKWPKTIIYEAHVKGLTMKHPLIPDDIRGSFAALSDPALIDHMHRIGITSLELLPIHAFAQDRHLIERNLRNYWGYNTLAFFAPETNYLHSGDLEEIATTVDRLHEAGIELILDVVYNHTCEGNHLGPTLSWKGIDNLSYYRSLPGEPRYYDNLTGCGNALNTSHPKVLQMVMDSLRMWTTVYGVDGFRFDLALTLGREDTGFTARHPFFHTILQDPILSRCKLIAEPWDVGPGGYQLGEFPPGFSEWNGDYRDVTRDFWKGDEGCLAKFAGRFAASSDLFDAQHRRPWSSVNFVTAHDGFTLHDLVSYNEKHNEANGEDNNDGANDNRSWNCGVEGETEDAEINALRLQQKKNFLITLFLSQGVPMLLAGDELHNSQGGNNNTYCQDSEIGWIDWQNPDKTLIELVGLLAQIRRENNAISRAEFLTGVNKHGNADVAWYNVNGQLMTNEQWEDPFNKSLIVKLMAVDKHQASILVIFNASHIEIEATIPECEIKQWHFLVSSSGEGKEVKQKDILVIPARSIHVYKTASS